MHRHDTKRRLESEQPAEAGRNPDRPATIGSNMQRAHAESRSDRSAAAAATRRHAAVPRIHRYAGERTVGHALPAKFRRGGLAQKHGTLFFHARHRWTIFGPRLLRVDGARAAQCWPALRHDEILHRAWDAVHASRWRALAPAC